MATGLLIGTVHAQSMYECRNAAGAIEYSDKACTAGAKPLKNTEQPDAAARKAANDARIARDKALADRLEAEHRAEEQAGYAAQDRQRQVDKSIADRMDQERASQQNSTTSTTANLPNQTVTTGATPVLGK